MPVQIHGKEYKTVAERVLELHNLRDDVSIETEILDLNIFPENPENDQVVIRATISLSDGRKFTGIAHEIRGGNYINKTSYVEVCETSAIGRACASLGIVGTEYASADEIANALKNQKR